VDALYSVAGASKLGSYHAQMTIQSSIGLSITDPPAAAHLERKPKFEKMDFKPAIEIPAKMMQCQPGYVSVLERVLSVNDEGSDSDESRIDVSEWVKCDKCMLDVTDKKIFESGDKLTDKHIQMSQYLLKR